MKKPYFGRLLTAMVTPFNADGSVNYAAGADFADWLLANGSDGLVVEGSTGEAATMDMDEKIKFMQTIVARVNGRAKIVAGAGTNCTASTIDLVKKMEACGVDGVLVVGPYYNKPTQEGYYQHFAAVAKATKLPIIVYNVPGRTVADLANETIVRLAQVDNIIGVKDATGDIGRGIQLLKQVPKDFAVYSGDDSTAAALILMGAQGNISVTANIAPKLMDDLCVAALNQDVVEVRRLNAVLCDLNKLLFVEANPIPVKWALAEMGKIGLGIRLPLTVLSEGNQSVIRAALKSAQLS